ncbi:sporulation protein YqfD [Paenisporosarcina cavernae]|uniref:sporulation protein YqfD n=1 Tax=Paenisporosarcina cavernae TaxID=2320858 RepID=UPI003083E484
MDGRKLVIVKKIQNNYRITFHSSYGRKHLQTFHEHKIPIRRVHIANETIHFVVSSNDYLKVKEYFHRHHITFQSEIIPKWNFLHVSIPHQLGSLLFISLPIIFSLFLWEIEIVDEELERKEEISQLLSQLPIKQGQPLTNVPKDDVVRRTILSKHTDIAWIHLFRDGGKLTIRIQSSPDPIITANRPAKPSDLVAQRKAIVSSFKLSSGERVVSMHDSVSKGELLVKGTIETPDGPAVIGAEGSVLGEFWIERSFSLSTKQKIVSRDRYLNEILLPIIAKNTIMSLSSDGEIIQEKVLHIEWTNDTVKGKILYLVKDRISSYRIISQGD